MKRRHFYRFLEFFIVGFVLGVTEDILAIHFATDATITIEVVYIAALVALPFAVFSELIVDWKHVDFVHKRVDGVKKIVKRRVHLFSK